jgi:hypothetical protein
LIAQRAHAGGIRRAGRFVSLLLAAMLAGCASAAAPSLERSADASADACCNDVETAPSWFVRALDPAAPLVGRIVAQIVWRKGYLHGETEVMDTLRDALQPLDIVLVTNKGRMSNLSLPGYFVHAAVYLGDERELRRAGVWDDGAVEPYRSDVRAGKRFIEADSRGVHLSPPRVTLNSDRLVVIRPRGLSAERRREALSDFFASVGGRFDFRFDAETPECFYCIELVQRIVPEIDLPLREAYGRKVFVTDDLARAAANGYPSASFVVYIRGDRDGWERATREDLRRDLANNWTH